MPASLRIALVGVSHWHAPRYAEALRARGALLCGASDTDPAAGATAAARLGVEFIAPTEAMIERLRPDFAVVLPRHDHAADEIARVAALRVPMLVEKPMGRHAQEAERLLPPLRPRASSQASACPIATWRSGPRFVPSLQQERWANFDMRISAPSTAQRRATAILVWAGCWNRLQAAGARCVISAFMAQTLSWASPQASRLGY